MGRISIISAKDNSLYIHGEAVLSLLILFADHITKIPLGYHLTIGSGRLRKIMDENIESVEGFIAHQFPDFVASVTAPIVMVIIL